MYMYVALVFVGVAVFSGSDNFEKEHHAVG